MRKSDMNGHRYRYRGVYYCLAEDFVAVQLSPTGEPASISKVNSFTDVVTLIEMRETPSIVFEFEPITWILYNKFVELSGINDSKSHGKFYPAMTEAFKCLEKTRHEKCALSLFFLTDGKPSDHVGDWSRQFPQNILTLVAEKSLNFGNRLNFSTVGYGSDGSNFNLLQQLVDTATNYGVKANFTLSSIDTCGITTSLT